MKLKWNSINLTIKKSILFSISLLSLDANAEKFLSFIHGNSSKSEFSNRYLGIIEIENNQLLSITPITKKQYYNLKSKYPVKRKNGKIQIIYPSDYILAPTGPDVKVAKDHKSKRDNSWRDYLKRGEYSLFLDKDPSLSGLPYQDRQRVMNKRNKRWDDLIQLYYDGDYISVTDNAPDFYGWKSHRAAAAFLNGVSYSRFNELNKSLKELNRSISYRFKNPQVYFEKGKVLFSLDRLPESYEAFKESLKRNNQRYLSMYYLGWIKENQKDYQVALNHYEELLGEKYIDIETAQSVELRRAEIFDKITTESNVDPKLKSDILNKKVMLPGRKAYDMDPDSTNGVRLKEFLQKLQQKFDLPSLIPFKVGSMGNYVRLNQYLSYDTNVPAVADDALEFKDSFLTNTIFVYKHFFSSRKGFRHTPELRLNYVTHFERNISSIYSMDTWNIGPSFRNSFKHNTFGKPSQFVFDIETSYTARDYDGDRANEFFSKSLKLNIGENLNIFKIGGTNIKIRQDFRSFFDSNLDSTTFTLFVNQLFSLSNKRTISLIANADFTSVEDDTNSTNSYLARIDYLHPRLIGKWELQTALSFLGTDTKEQSDVRGFETNISYEMEWRRKFLKDFEFALNYNYTVNSSKDEDNFSFNKHLVALELQYSPSF